ncbi:MAG: hypothetical protein M3Y51_03595 [Actinomycetota bacterium]|nr:hypothetical protein [Actinomycetota bacterium]
MTAAEAVTIPLGATVGEHHLYMYGTTSRTGVGGLTQVAADPAGAAGVHARPTSLAFTGAGTAMLLALGAALVLAGASLQYHGARRSIR